jgi:glycosyltransferase involved in cell wall biosynthesis
MKEMLHILHLPKWYPHNEDPQLGIFIKKQILAASEFHMQSVLYIRSVKKLPKPFIVEEVKAKNLLEITIYYQKPESRTKQFIILKKLYSLGFKKIKNTIGPPDLLHVHNLVTPAIWANKYSKKRMIPWILSEHWSGYTPRSGVFRAKMKWEKKLWKWYSEKAAVTIAVSEFLLDALKKNGIGTEHLVIPNVVEGDFIEIKRNDDEIRILNVSDMVDEVKNISGLLLAFSILVKEFPSTKLYLVGGGEDLENLKTFVQDLGIQDQVYFYGRLANDQVLKLYHEIDFTVINSRVETFSVVAAESLMAGKPVISTRSGGVQEFITKDQGILIPVNNEEKLLDALKTMRMSYADFDPKTLSEYAKGKFSARSVGIRLTEVYESILHD